MQVLNLGMEFEMQRIKDNQGVLLTDFSALWTR